MALPAGYVYRDGAYWYDTAGPYYISDSGGAVLAPHGVQGPSDSSYFYHAGGYWRSDGSGPYVKTGAGEFFLRM